MNFLDFVENLARGVKSIAKYGNTGCQVFNGEEGGTKLERLFAEESTYSKEVIKF